MSKVFKGGAGAQSHGLPWRGETAAASRGVGAFRPKRVGETKTAAPAVAPEPEIDLDAVRKQAFQEGFVAGQKGAEKQAAEQFAKKLAEAARVFDEVAGYKSALRSEAEQELVDLAFAIARRIVRRELGVDRTAVGALVKTCMQDFPAVSVKKVMVHPDDLSLVREALGPGVEAAPDASIARGGAVLETDQGRLDARIDSQLEEIALGLADG